MIHLGENVIDMVLYRFCSRTTTITSQMFLQYDADVGIIMPLFPSRLTLPICRLDLALIVKYILACPRHS